MRFPRTVSRRRVLLALVGLELLLLFVLLRDSTWVYDDNLFLELARHQGFNVQSLLAFKFQHWLPAYNFTFTVLLHLFPLDFRWALGVLLALLGASALLLERSVSMLFGRSTTGVLVAGWFTLLIVFLPSLQWFASGAQVLPVTLLDLLCLYGWLRHRADGSRRWLGISWAAVAAGLLFFEKAGFMPAYLALIRVLFMMEDLRPAAVARAFWRERRQWIPYGVIVLAWGAAFLSRHPPLAAGPVALGQYGTFFRIFWVDTLVPAVAGVVVPGAGLTALQTLFVSLAQVAVIVVVVASLRTKPSAWRAWLFLAICVAVIGGLVAHARVAQFTVQIGNDLRYQFEFAWLVPLAVCFAFSPRVTVLPNTRPRDTSRVALPRAMSRRTTVVGVLGAVYVAACVFSVEHITARWPAATARAWENHLRAGLHAGRTPGRQIVLANNILPPYIVGSQFPPYNALADLVALYDPHTQVDGPLVKRLTLVDAGGNFKPAAEGSVVDDWSIGDLERRLATGGAAPTYRAGRPVHEACVSGRTGALTIERRLPRIPSAAGGPYYVELGYSSRRPFSMAAVVDTGAGYLGAHQGYMAIDPAARSSIVWLGPGAPHRFALTMPYGSSLCIKRFAVITLRPGRDPSARR